MRCMWLPLAAPGSRGREGRTPGTRDAARRGPWARPGWQQPAHRDHRTPYLVGARRRDDAPGGSLCKKEPRPWG